MRMSPVVHSALVTLPAFAHSNRYESISSQTAPAHHHRGAGQRVTHGLGLGLSIVGFVVLLVFAALRGTPWQIVACAIYGSTLVCLYAASTLYHAVPSPRF